MCGIVGGVSYKDVSSNLLIGIKRLEYRGYDSAGLALITDDNKLVSLRVKGKINKLIAEFRHQPIAGRCGLAHTRWATHGVPSKKNAHPHISHNQLAIVHNGIIENYEMLRSKLESEGYQFNSDTDSEVIVHLIYFYLQQTHDLLLATQEAIASLEGMFAFSVISITEPNTLVVARSGSPLVIGLGDKENYIASDTLALLPITHQFIFLEDGDVGKITSAKIQIYNSNGELTERKTFESKLNESLIDRGEFSHYMEKEIFEQPESVSTALEGRITKNNIPTEIFGVNAPSLFDKIDNVMLVACGTSYYAAEVAQYWLEEIAGISAKVEIASEYRYRNAVIKSGTLFVAISQSGETADTLAAFRLAKTQNYLATLAICNVPDSSLVREADLVFLTHAGPEICVASTKSFTTQLVALFMLTIVLGRYNKITTSQERDMVTQLRDLPSLVRSVLKLNKEIKKLAEFFAEKNHALFLGRGSLYPVALEGALKLKEISYIHAEGYPAGELKHGPLAIVDKDMPVVVVAPNNDLLEKLKSNLQEVKARGGELIIFADESIGLKNEPEFQIINMPVMEWFLTPILYAIPLQLLAYYVGIIKGTDVDQPRNLAKSVTVE